jgi:dolichyl-phosphate beta-glucosyltransferase
MNACIIVPCYNEAKRIPTPAFNNFLSKDFDTQILFVNDGSTDDTAEVLQKFRTLYPKQVEVLNLEKNLGKGNAVRMGIQNALHHTDCTVFGFLDADLSTSLEEWIALTQLITDKTEFVFGSRFKKIDNSIERKWFRFVVGRFIATAISKALNLAVYDTQCGCKLFSRNATQLAFASPFISPWLFDVELFFRLKNHYGTATFKAKSMEIPLKNWTHQEDSKIKWTYGFTMWFDLFKIKRAYS